MVKEQESATMPAWIRKHMNSADMERIEQAIKVAEAKTSGEIAPVVVQRSIHVSHIPLIVTLILLTSFLAADGLHWEGIWFGANPLWLPLDVVVACVLGWTLAKLGSVRRLLTSKHEQAACVHTAAQAAFLTSGLAHTQRATGVLIFVSLLEKRTVVLADAAVTKVLPEHTWDGVVNTINTATRAESLGAGLAKGIAELAELLKGPFPHRDGVKSEVPDRVVFLDGDDDKIMN